MTDVATLARERRGLVAFLRGLPDDAWQRPSLCAGWTVHHVLAHLTTPFLVSVPAMGVRFLRHGVSGAMRETTAALVRRPPAELLDVLEAGAASAFRPPGFPLATPMTDVVAHGADVRWALSEDRADPGDPARLADVLGFLTGVRAAVGFVPPRRLVGLRLEATDLDWRSGKGAPVRGPGLALVLGVLGRDAALPLLAGDGVARLAARCRG